MANLNNDKVSNSEKAFRGMHSQTAVVAIRAVGSLVYFSLMSRLLTPKDFGVFALLTAVTTILNSLSEAGIGSAVIQKKDPDKGYISTAFTLSLIFGLICTGALLCLANPLSSLLTDSNELAMPLRLMSVTIVLQAVNYVTQSLYMRKLEFFRFGILQICAEFLSYGVGVYLAYTGHGFYSIVWATISMQVFLTLILAFMRKYDFALRIQRNCLRPILSYGGWLTASVITRNLTNQIDKMIVGRLLSVTDLGALNRPSGFVERISSQINGIFDTILFPILSGIQDDKKRIESAFIKTASLMILMSSFLASCIILGSKYVIDIFFGSQWAYLQPILMIFGAASIMHGFSRICDCFYRSLGIVKSYFVMRVINWILVISLVVIGCQFGITAVALCMFTATFLSQAVKLGVLRRHIDVKWTTMFKAFVKNGSFTILLLLICFPIMIFVPGGDYWAIWVYVAFAGLAALLFPKCYGSLFVEMVADRYLKKFSKLRLR